MDVALVVTDRVASLQHTVSFPDVFFVRINNAGSHTG